MSFAKISKIIMYVIAGISLLVILFFYAGPKTIDFDVDKRVEELASQTEVAEVTTITEPDIEESDSLTTDSAAVATAMEEMPAEEVAVVEEIDLREHLSGWEYLVYVRTDIALVWAYILLLLTGIAAIVFPLVSVFSNPKGLIRLGGVLVGAAVIILVAYLVSSGNPIDITGYTGEANRDPGTLKMVDTTLFVTYMLFGLAILSILYSIVARLFK